MDARTAYEPVDASFFNRPTLELARRLLAAELVHLKPGPSGKRFWRAGRIVETEAYMGRSDTAAHSYGGRRTDRTRVMFGPPGRLYVYISYGIHVCCNVVSGPEGDPQAVLIRALEPTAGERLMAKRRQLAPGRPRVELTNGPGKLCQAMGITMDHYGHDLARPPLFIARGSPPVAADRIECGPRVGIEGSGEARHHPWRFWINDNPFVSRG